MRPSAFTDGNDRIRAVFVESQHRRFNEAVGFHRRKPAPSVPTSHPLLLLLTG